MSGCRRFDEEGLDLLEAGEPLGEHFSTCPECRARRAAYEALREDLAVLGAGEEPPAGWRDRVRREVRGRPGQAPRVRRVRPRLGSWWPLPALAAAAAIAFLVLVPGPPEPSQPTLQARFERGSVAYRGDEVPRPGDTLVLEAEGDRRRHLELRVYRNERELLARCGTGESAEPGSATCRHGRGRLVLRLALDAVGRYQPFVALTEEPLGIPAGGLDADVGAVLSEGGRVEMGDEVVVR